MKDYILYIVLRAVLFLMRLLPLRAWLCLAGGAGWLYYYFAGKKNRRAYAHMRLAFPERSRRERNRIIQKMYMRFAQNYFETLYLPFLDARYIRDHVAVPMAPVLKEAFKGGHGGIFLASHAGSWELSNIACAQLFPEVRYGMLVQPQKRYKRLDAFLNGLRESKNVHVFRVDELKKVVMHLQANNILGVVADHGGKDGVPIEFFGKLAMTPVGSIRLARKLGCKIFVAYMRRIKGPYHEILFEPYELINTGDETQDLKVNLSRINKIFEGWIAQYPEEYLWFYKRWKYSSQRNILVLSDGKAGHVKQSLALAQMIAQLKAVVIPRIVEVRYKNGASPALLSLAGLFLGPGFLRLFLPFFLTERSYREITSGAHDVVVSAGASLAAVNLAVGFENNAQSIAIMRPGILPLTRFNLVIMPEHDRPARRPDVLAITGSLNSVTPESMAADFQELLKAQKELKGLETAPHPRIGLLIGGDSKNYELLPESTDFLCLQLEKILEEKDAIIFLSTSRRTSPEVLRVLASRFRDKPRCKLFVDASTYNPPGTVGGIFYLSDIVIVSGESISMVSEAAASGKHTLVFEPKCTAPDNKVRKFLDSLAAKKMIHLVKLNEVYDKVLWLMTARPGRVPMDERSRILEGLRKILG